MPQITGVLLSIPICLRQARRLTAQLSQIMENQDTLFKMVC